MRRYAKELGTEFMASSLSDDTIGIIITPITIPALSALNTSISGKSYLQQRRHECQREVAVHDRRDAGEYLKHRLDDAAHPVGRVLGQEDGSSESDRKRDQRRNRAAMSSVPPTSGSTP